MRPPMREPRFWLGVALAEHCRRCVEGGFVQLGHGHAAPVGALAPGDGIALYAPREGMREGASVQAFVAVGLVADGEPYAADMGEGFVPARRDVAWDRATHPAPIRSLLDWLSFAAGRPDWGMVLLGILRGHDHRLRVDCGGHGLPSHRGPIAALTGSARALDQQRQSRQPAKMQGRLMEAGLDREKITKGARLGAPWRPNGQEAGLLDRQGSDGCWASDP